MRESRTRLPRLADRILIGIFVAAISVPFLGSFFGWEVVPGLRDGRSSTPLPTLAPKRSVLTAFPAQFEAYYDKQFGLRNSLIRCLSLIKVQGFKVPASPHVVIGKHGWLYYALEPPGRDTHTREPLSAKQLDAWQQRLEARDAWLAKRGIPYLFVIVPEKQTIYPEFLPENLRQREAKLSRLDQLARRLKDRSSVQIIDLREPLLLAKRDGPVYHRTDSHWNSHGAFVAAQRIVSELQPWFPEVRPARRSSLMTCAANSSDCDLARLLGLAGFLREDSLLLLPIQPFQSKRTQESVELATQYRHPAMDPFVMEKAGARLPRAVVFCDSYVGALAPFLSEHLSRAVYLPEDAPGFDANVVERERPDVVIHEMTERKLFLDELPPDSVEVGAK